MKKIIYTRSDGRLCVIHPVINTHPTPEQITEDEALERARKDIPPDAIDPQIVDEAAVPADRTFRNAWTAAPGQIVHDMAKCRAIHRDRIRALRKPLLESLDAQWMKAIATGDSGAAAAAEAKRQRLRDAPADPSIDAARTVDELKAVVPAGLA